ncbi:uncharacterized protein LOC143830449 [Paroedura picta]|uniref:uncharacterized protein LOC143830449 n=1 Tax=Paroedura picta TaxID=143630 RepID=UPI0040571BE7
MSMLKRLAHLIEIQTQDYKVFLDGLIKNISKEIQDGKEEVFNRNDGSITVTDDSFKQGGKPTAEEKSEIQDRQCKCISPHHERGSPRKSEIHIFKEIQDAKEDVFNRNNGSITVADDSSKQGGKPTVEEKSEILETENGRPEFCSPDKDTLFKKTYSHLKATVYKNQSKEIWICSESNRFKGSLWGGNCIDTGVQEVQRPQDLSMHILRERVQLHFLRQRPMGQNIILRERQDVASLEMRPP